MKGKNEIYGIKISTNILSNFREMMPFFIANPIRPDWDGLYEEWCKFVKYMDRHHIRHDYTWGGEKWEERNKE